jgi:hypothetical protein
LCHAEKEGRSEEDSEVEEVVEEKAEECAAHEEAPSGEGVGVDGFLVKVMKKSLN